MIASDLLRVAIFASLPFCRTGRRRSSAWRRRRFRDGSSGRRCTRLPNLLPDEDLPQRILCWQTDREPRGALGPVIGGVLVAGFRARRRLAGSTPSRSSVGRAARRDSRPPAPVGAGDRPRLLARPRGRLRARPHSRPADRPDRVEVIMLASAGVNVAESSWRRTRSRPATSGMASSWAPPHWIGVRELLAGSVLERDRLRPSTARRSRSSPSGWWGGRLTQRLDRGALRRRPRKRKRRRGRLQRNSSSSAAPPTSCAGARSRS